MFLCQAPLLLPDRPYRALASIYMVDISQGWLQNCFKHRVMQPLMSNMIVGTQVHGVLDRLVYNVNLYCFS